MAAEMGNQHYSPGIPALVELLGHEDELVRYNAVNSLAFEFHHKPIVTKLLAMLAEDSDEDNRRIAAAALGGLSQDSQDRRVLAALAKAALNDPDEDVRKSAYKALLSVNGLSREQHLRVLTDPNLPVDMNRVKAILAEIPG
jgi:HEAT repeat protein